MRTFGPVMSIAACVLAVALPSRTRAQEIAPGAHVRVAPVNGATPLEGSLVAKTADSLRVRVSSSELTVALAMDSVRSIDVGQSARTKGAVTKGAIIGAAVGVAAGIALSQTRCATRSHRDNNGPSCPLEDVVFAVPLGIVGGLLGAFIAKNDNNEQWNRVYERDHGTALFIGPRSRHGFELGFSVAFGGVTPQ